MSEKNKVKFVKLTKSQRKLFIADQQEMNELMMVLQQKLDGVRNKLRQSRLEDFSVELNIEDGFVEGEWAFNSKQLRFEKVPKVVKSPDAPPDGPPLKNAKETIPGKETKPGKEHKPKEEKPKEEKPKEEKEEVKEEEKVH